MIGCPRSGKSTFSRSLHKATQIPLYHLDMMNWTSDRTIVPNFEDFINALHKHTKDYDNELEEEVQKRFQSTIYKAKKRDTEGLK